MRIDVAATLTMSSPEPATALLQIAVADPLSEQLTVLSDGTAVEAEEFEVNGARVHRLQLLAGDTTVTYSASTEDGGSPRKVTPPSGPRPCARAATARRTSWRVSRRQSSTGRRRAQHWSRPWPIGCTGGWSTPPVRAAPSTPPSTPCSPARACAATTRT
ncbi:hypothetical protein [Blastococcus brunescens]|uniref:Uncharacterized protein n=1 Tax=Blastococcus brunescens TaxID=1564165 RepID=A0ABZ1B3F4_9ACTN|nr:hypothetical protein [Blastococcus sp. BMG 8361]WRL65323.1 hypothetical protein U6N30_06635 [Blastococcus sp. BMG 8361]